MPQGALRWQPTARAAQGLPPLHIGHATEATPPGAPRTRQVTPSPPQPGGSGEGGRDPGLSGSVPSRDRCPRAPCQRRGQENPRWGHLPETWGTGGGGGGGDSRHPRSVPEAPRLPEGRWLVRMAPRRSGWTRVESATAGLYTSSAPWPGTESLGAAVPSGGGGGPGCPGPGPVSSALRRLLAAPELALALSALPARER